MDCLLSKNTKESGGPIIRQENQFCSALLWMRMTTATTRSPWAASVSTPIRSNLPQAWAARALSSFASSCSRTRPRGRPDTRTAAGSTASVPGSPPVQSASWALAPRPRLYLDHVADRPSRSYSVQLAASRLPRGSASPIQSPLRGSHRRHD